MTRKKTAASRDNSLLIGTSQFVLLYGISFLTFIWRTVKYENIYLQDYRSPRKARQGISEYLTYDNQQRPHQLLDYCTPAEGYFGKKGTS